LDLPEDVTRLLQDWGQGDVAARDKLMSVVYEELRHLADHYFRGQRPDHTLQPTALVHEAYLRMAASDNKHWKNRVHFFAAAAQIMRHILINHALARKTAKRGAGYKVTLTDAIGNSEERDWDVLAVDEALKKLAAADPRRSRMIELRFFAGLTNEQIADVLNVSLATVNRDWRLAKAWLQYELKK
jgi:RNA polymerase sigma-70 factor (ECF subfamily)